MSDPLIDLQDIRLTLGQGDVRTEILKGVSLRLDPVESVAVPLELADAADARDRAKSELEAVGLGHRLTHYPAQLSGGEQQRVAIARATAPRPALLFADEPTGNLDAATGTAILDLLFERQRGTGATLLVITHDPALAARCGRVLEMQDGRIVRDTRA